MSLGTGWSIWIALVVWQAVGLTPVLTDVSLVRHYTSENFKRSIRELHGNFIMFYAPWCSQCTVFQPIWSQLAEMVNTPESRISIAQVDCTVESSLCSDNDITGYPSLQYYNQNSLQPSEYRGTRDLPSLTLFLNEVMTANDEDLLNVTDLDEVKIFKGMAYLTEQNFEKFVSTGQHFIMFYVPWCGVSQNLAPTWATLAEDYQHNTSVQISKLDCMEHRLSCLNFEIRDYPHLLWLLNGKLMEAISGPQSLESLKQFVESMARPENHNPERFLRRKKIQPVATITEDTFDLYMEKDLVFINYYAAWCAHCKLMVPTWLELARRLLSDSRVVVGDVDCAQQEALCVQEQVHHFPTLVLYKNSRVIFQHQGSTSLDNLVQEVERHLKSGDASVQIKDEL